MDDLEMVRRCAEAMGMPYQVANNGSFVARMDSPTHTYNGTYNPLTDDAQAMALVKRLKLMITLPDSDTDKHDDTWFVYPDGDNDIFGQSADLNRAIVTAVANMPKQEAQL